MGVQSMMRTSGCVCLASWCMTTISPVKYSVLTVGCVTQVVVRGNEPQSCRHRRLEHCVQVRFAVLVLTPYCARGSFSRSFVAPSPGIDLLGHPVVVFVAGHIPAPKVDLRRVLMYIVRVCGFC